MNELYSKILSIPYLPNFIKKLMVIGINWTFQSVLYMDRTERTFKLTFNLIFTVIFAMLLVDYVKPLMLSVIIAFIISHTLNWTFNNNLFGLFKTFGNVITPRGKFEEYIKRLQMRIENEPSIVWAGIYGSLVRGEFKETSDLDVRLIRKPGFINGVRACIFVMKERTWANFHKFPLDIYVFDSYSELLTKMKQDESPEIIYKDHSPGVGLH